eukprot:1157319-Pelagomonas_calceolata.AAC.16
MSNQRAGAAQGKKNRKRTSNQRLGGARKHTHGGRTHPAYSQMKGSMAGGWQVDLEKLIPS